MGQQKLFFSYARADGDFALKLATDLRKAGVDLWLDQLDIGAGERWDRSIEKALEEHPALLVILSPDSVASTNVMDEVSYALEEGKRLVPVLHKECKLPFRLRRIQHVDFSRDYKAGFAELLHELGLGGKQQFVTPEPEPLPDPDPVPPDPDPVPGPTPPDPVPPAPKPGLKKLLPVAIGIVLLVAAVLVWRANTGRRPPTGPSDDPEITEPGREEPQPSSEDGDAGAVEGTPGGSEEARGPRPVDPPEPRAPEGPLAEGPPFGEVTIQPRGTERFLDAEGTSIVVRAAQADGSQTWILARGSGDSYTLRQKSTGLFLDGSESLPKASRSDAKAQWNLLPLGDGLYKIQPVRRTRMVLKLSEDYLRGAGVLGSDEDTPDKQWAIARVDAAQRRPDPEPTREPTTRPTVGKLALPAWVILDDTFAEERDARAWTAKMLQLGLPAANYYYIPDLFPRGSKAYQTFAGPITSKAAIQKAVCEYNRVLGKEGAAVYLTSGGRQDSVTCETGTRLRRRPG